FTVIDSHAHLTDERLLPDLERVLERARAAGVEAVVTIGTHREDWARVAELAGRFPEVHAVAGVHPHTADDATDEAMAELRELALAGRIVGLGETGLDYFYDNAPREAQRAAFLSHLELARETGLPVVVHTRSADEDTADILADARGVTGVLHCFSGGRALLERALEAGWYVSFAGMITFKKYEDAELVRAVPADRILVETDSPYLAPVPFRGRTNEPGFVVHTARRAAEIRGEDPAVFAAAAVRNTRAFYRLG
ncbi:MAG TPA: TatD family hydrolase, partial [Longimicrobiaceae bacterium]|nr:TatD family hydrolase [Longimicrobiaceae bacterium]